jgi:prepilin-type N-terminal cleavage/methylation domain-containing protein
MGAGLLSCGDLFGFVRLLSLQSIMRAMTPAMTRRANKALGMSLVELMIVVVIIGILAAISMVGYRKYIARARLSEATAMLAEFAAKEQLYFLDNGLYAEAHNDNVAQKAVSDSEEPSEFWPQNPNVNFDSVRTPVAVAPLPASWRTLGIRPRWQQLYCTYMVNVGSGEAGSRPPGTVGPTLWTATPNVPWFYAMAACNLQGDAGWPDKVTLLLLTHDSPAIRTSDEKQ